MILASIEGAIGAAAITLLILATRWIGGRFGGNDAEAKAEKNQVQKSAAALGVKGGSEEERMRRFLEALGIPADAPEGQRPATPPPLRPAPQREEKPKPVKPAPPVWGEPWPKSQKQSPPPLVKRPAQKPKRHAEPPPLVQTVVPSVPSSAEWALEEKAREAAEFKTITTAPVTSPDETGKIREVAGVSRPQGGELWREALRTPEGLRSAFILREVLGPPPGLQRF